MILSLQKPGYKYSEVPCKTLEIVNSLYKHSPFTVSRSQDMRQVSWLAKELSSALNTLLTTDRTGNIPFVNYKKKRQLSLGILINCKTEQNLTTFQVAVPHICNSLPSMKHSFKYCTWLLLSQRRSLAVRI